MIIRDRRVIGNTYYNVIGIRLNIRTMEIKSYFIKSFVPPETLNSFNEET